MVRVIFKRAWDRYEAGQIGMFEPVLAGRLNEIGVLIPYSDPKPESAPVIVVEEIKEAAPELVKVPAKPKRKSDRGKKPSQKKEK